VNEKARLRVVVVDDSEVVRAKLRQLFASGEAAEIEHVGEAPDGEAGVRLIAEQQPDVVVMDLKMPGISGVEATWQLGTVAPSAQVVVLTVSDDQADVADAIMAGAKGYIVKGAADSEILDAVRRVAAGQRAISPQVASELVERTQSPMSVEAAKGSTPSPPVREAPARDAGPPAVPWTRNPAATLIAGFVIGVLLGYALG
jgi:DNA-binding NarL/FixJ family response regulator